MKGNNHRTQLIDHGFSFTNGNLWSQKFGLKFNGMTKDIEMYEIATMKLHRTLPFYYFDVNGFIWNLKYPSFVAYDEDGLMGIDLASMNKFSLTLSNP